MYLEISSSGEKYKERLHQKEFKDSEDESMDELLLTLFVVKGPMDDTELVGDMVEGWEDWEKDRFKKGVRRLFQKRYLQEIK